MRLLRGLICLSLLASGVQTIVLGQVPSGFVRSNQMENAWKSHVQLPMAGRGLVSSHFYADAQNSRQFAIVELPSKTIRVPADMADRDGNPIGMEKAKEIAQQQASRFLGKPDGFEVVEATVPQIKLVLLSSDGLVQTLDAESGRVLWSTSCGNFSAPAYPASISPFGIAVIHGIDLYLLDWQTGRILNIMRLRNAASNSVSLCGDLAFVTDYSGRVDSYRLSEPQTNPYTYVMAGHTVGKPVELNSLFSAFATDAGYMYVFAGGDRPAEWIRYESASSITGSLAARGDSFYIGNSAGVLQKISLDDRTGKVDWVVRAAETLTAPALVVGDDAIIASEAGSLAAIDDRTGEVRWMRSRIDAVQPIAVSGNKVFCTTKLGNIIAVDRATGRSLGASARLSLGTPLVNELTDRVYVVSRTGQIQCFRPVGADLPTIYASVPPAAAEEEGLPGATQVPGQEPQTPAGGDPFAPAAGATTPAGDPFADPFGTTPATDPFGGGNTTAPPSDPFGGGNTTAPPNDPFGGGATGGNDPFGGATGGSTGGDPFGSGGSVDDPFGSGN
ncbi:MAG: PQQ-like beta-propeller repeat protein [bacterium]|nr:PQQ-like beta-propeller repeat protein [bacterium]